ncbi:hypothetical protein N7516_001930 [Penicillium verrucosum]|uniref:uncharacterized protein n=1 Tax=Penicillium verrucosum TaxID=60171 RepID=UPI0025452ADF|nr:uncharacterized protein N7516_001930 [Penicillium verrucosum]KAJ5941762.1 hypothetical protein N7516_001930 [Penicillium verrucosum]
MFLKSEAPRDRLGRQPSLRLTYAERDPLRARVGNPPSRAGAPVGATIEVFDTPQFGHKWD